MSALRRSQLALVACAMALVLAVVAWRASSIPAGAPLAASVSDVATSSLDSAADRTRSAPAGDEMLGEREAAPTELGTQLAGAAARPIERVLRGRVACEDIAGFQFRVAVFAFDGRVPSPAPLDETFTDSDGPYVLRVERAGEFALLAFAQGHRPATLRFSIAAQVEIELPPLRLEPGAAISGAVHNAWTDGVRETIVRVSASETDASVRSVVREAVGGRFVWRDGAFDWAEVDANVSPDSIFWLFGLRPASYSLSVHDVGALGLEFRDVERVHAPAANVLLTVSACTLNLHLFSAGAPASNVTFTVRSTEDRSLASSRSLATDGAGNASIMLVPYSHVEFRRGEVVRLITAGAGGDEFEMSIDL